MCPGFIELVVGVWAGDEAVRSCLSLHKYVLQTSFTPQLCHCCVQSLQGKRIFVEAVRKLVEKNQKQSFPVGE